MVSAFLCECLFGFLMNRGLNIQTPILMPQKLFGPEATVKDNADLVKQTMKAMSIFKILHPDCDALFIFDNSANHHAYAPDTLVASRLNLTVGGKNIKIIIRDGFFENAIGDAISQSFRNENGVQKGLRTILQDRQLWVEGYSAAWV